MELKEQGRSGRALLAALALLALSAAPFIFNACSGGGGGGASSGTSAAPVSGLTVTPGAGEVALTWEPVAGAKSYAVFWGKEPVSSSRSAKSGGEKFQTSGSLPNVITGIINTAYFHTGLLEGFKYNYQVVALKSETVDPLSIPHPEWAGVGCTLENGCYMGRPYLCGGVCLSVSYDDANCGKCGNVCPSGTRCWQGVCQPTIDNGCIKSQPYVCQNVFGSGTTCGGDDNPSYCGSGCVNCFDLAGSGNYVSAGCRGGECKICAEREVYCGQSGCANIYGDVRNCGACGHVCASGQTCQNGYCVGGSTGGGGGGTCTAIETNCNGTCTRLLLDPANCGACGNACPSNQVCEAGACVGACAPSLTECSRSCTNLNNDGYNCGACGAVCPAGPDGIPLCDGSGKCLTGSSGGGSTGGGGGATCSSPFTSCGGSCVFLERDQNNCGACGTACSSSQICIGGKCQNNTVTCSAPYVDCFGLCVDVNASASNCGKCGFACAAGEVCSKGACVPPPCAGSMCGGVCTDIWTDFKNCGGCGIACSAGQTCTGGKCVTPCSGIVCGGVCTDPLFDVNNCGKCGNVCGKGFVCKSGVCV